MRSAVNAWLEDISFRTGVTALIVVAALVIGGAIAAIDLTAYGGGSSPRHAPAAQALPATPQTASTAPASRPHTALPRHRPRPPGHTAPVAAAPAAAVPATAQTAPSPRPTARPRPGHHHQRAFPGWTRWPGGWRPGHKHGHHPGHRQGWPPGDEQGQQAGNEQGQARGDEHGWQARGPHGRHAGPHERSRPGRHARHAAGRHHRHSGDAETRQHAG
jgi:hypothetical protein